MNPIWLNSYPNGMPHTVEIDPATSLVDMLDDAVTAYGDKTAFSSFGGTLGYSDVDRLSRAFAAYLQTELGVRKGDRIALMCPNMMAFPVAMFGIVRTGAVQVNVNPLYTGTELLHQLTDADADIIVIFSGSTGTLADVIAETPIKTVITVNLGDFTGLEIPSPPVDERLDTSRSLSDAVTAGGNLAFSPPALDGRDLLFLQYTGGTTGLSKGAMLSHGNLVSNILQFEAWSKPLIKYGEDVVITAIPMYHIFALMVNTLSYFTFGATNVLITNPRDMPSFVAEWKKWRVNVFTGVNTLFNGLLHTPGFEKCDFSAMKYSIGGGAAVHAAVSAKWKEVTGLNIREGYGLSETSPVLTTNILTDDDFLSSIGLPLPSTDLSLRDDDGIEVALGEPGELCAKGPQVMVGYWRREQATADAMTLDGYFRTGDIATVDEAGFFRIVDRKKDMILVSGFNVYPNEIEAAVAHMDGVLEGACIGVPDDDTGEAVKLFVVKKDDTITAQDVDAHCRRHLTAYKVPKYIDFIDAIPKSMVGKLLRRELRKF